VRIANTPQSYGWPSIVMHWLMAVTLIGMYFVGDYMVDLGYYDKLYHTLPTWHKAIGVVLGVSLVIRFAWNLAQPKPKPADAKTGALAHLAAIAAHFMLYALVAVLIVSGYLISTAKGAGIEVFGVFEMPALLPDSAERGETAGWIHELIGDIFIILVGLHAAAALVHHFVFKDSTITYMIKPKGQKR